MRISGIAVLGLAVLTLAGCASTTRVLTSSPGERSRELPEDSMRSLAANIEVIVARGDRNAEVADPGDIVVDTPEIVQAVRTRAARREVLNELLDTGHAWERADGMIHILRSSAYKQSGNRHTRDRDALIVMGENRDRWTLYEGLVDANHYKGDALNRVKTIFAEARIVTLDSGHKFEATDGEVAIR